MLLVAKCFQLQHTEFDDSMVVMLINTIILHKNTFYFYDKFTIIVISFLYDFISEKLLHFIYTRLRY